MSENVKIIPLGGFGEFGKNMMVIAVADDWIIIDSGSAMPEDGMLGIDVVIPDFSILLENKEKLRGIILTHGHEPHLGSLPYLLEQLSLPVYGTKMTLAMAGFYLKEHYFYDNVEMKTVKPGERFRLGKLTCELIHACHDVYGASGVAIRTSLGWVINTGDFKIDYTPYQDENTDLDRLAALGHQGVFALLADSANAEHQGATISESVVAEKLAGIIEEAEARVVVHLYVTDLLRIQQVLDIAEKTERRVTLFPEQLNAVIARAESAGVLKYREFKGRGRRGRSRKPDLVVVASVPGQPYLGPLSGESGHRFQIEKNDTIILTGSYHAGTEKTLIRTIDMLYRQGAEEVHELISLGEISSHGGQEELKLLYSLTKPKFIIPIHGEHRHLVQAKEIALNLGWADQNVFVLENGEVLRLEANQGNISEQVPAEKVMVDGLGVGDIGNVVLKDRRILAKDGVVIVVITVDKANKTPVKLPQIESRGFLPAHESEQVFLEAMAQLNQYLIKQNLKSADAATIRNMVRENISRFLSEQTRRRPMVLPVILFV